ncbi:MAG: hypothetical protein JXA64_02470 [Candidatus Fermentibacteraceae bacterium]|nr:hypothetical protein [Candidatus Fermentibacteraceae bacterium]
MSDPHEELLMILDGELRTLDSLHPGLGFRFCRRMGRRISHITGNDAGPCFDVLRLPVGRRLLLLVSGPWRGHEPGLREYSEELTRRLGGRD